MNKTLMRKQLKTYRIMHKHYGLKVRLKGIPFYDYRELFCIEKIPRKNLTRCDGYYVGYNGCDLSPCTIFGRNLVLKIVDELLDD